MSKNNSEIIDKIKKLLIKHDGCKKIQSEAEAEVALKLAFNLMRKHHLDMSLLITEDSNSDSDIFIIEKECEKFIANELPVWLQNLIQVINIVCNTECILRKYKTNRSAKQLYINFIGESNDVSRCVDMYKFFKKTASRLAYKHQREIQGNFTNWRSFVEGFTSRLLEKALEEEKSSCVYDEKDEGFQDIQDTDDSESEFETNEVDSYELIIQKNDLIILNRYRNFIKEKIKSFIKNQDAKPEKLKESTIINSDSFYQGKVAANRYNFNKKIFTNLALENK